MEIRAIFEEVEAVWVNFEDDIEVLIAYADIDEIEGILKRHATFSYKGGKRKEKVDGVAIVKEIGRRFIKGWKGITLNGEEFSHNEENSDKLMTRWADFAIFVREACMEVSNFSDEEREEVEKNS